MDIWEFYNRFWPMAFMSIITIIAVSNSCYVSDKALGRPVSCECDCNPPLPPEMTER